MGTYSPEWIAGLITGEGCFSLSTNRLKQSKTGWLRITPVFSMTMTDIETMDGVIAAFKRFGLPVYVQDTISRSRGGAERPAKRIQVNGIKRLYHITSFFIPYLHGRKKEAAEAVHDFCEHRLTRHYRGISEIDIECVERVREANANNGSRNHSVSDLRDYKLRRDEQERFVKI